MAKKAIEYFIDSNGKKSAPGGVSGQPNLNWRPEGGMKMTARTDEDREKAAEFLRTLYSDLIQFKVFMQSRMEPYRRDKEKLLENADLMMTVCRKADEAVEAYNAIIPRMNAASEADNVEAFSTCYEELRVLCCVHGDYNKRSKIRQNLPAFMTAPRTMAAIMYDRIFAARDKAERHLRHMQMTPAQREAARKTSVRMQMQWGLG